MSRHKGLLSVGLLGCLTPSSDVARQTGHLVPNLFSARRLLLATFATTLGALACSSAPVLAAAPEVPEGLKAEPVTMSMLPDGRQWELVSPPDKHGALVEPIDIYGLIESSPEGGAFTYITSAPTEAQPQGWGRG
jgi:hypothetical protein